jgi:hypothetical protein
LVSIGLVVSEEKIFEKVYDVRRTTSDGKSSHGLWPGELKKLIILTSFANIEYYLFDIFLLIKFFGINITVLIVETGENNQPFSSY